MPFTSSVLAIVGLLFMKRAQQLGVSTWSTMILTAWSSALVFTALTLLGGTMQPVTLLWQPAVIGGLFLAGQFFMFMAVKLGDVSIAAPVLGVKVLIVPALGLLVIDDHVTANIWIAAALAVVGVALVQSSEANVDRRKIVFSVVFALLGALTMTVFDLWIQRWAPAWGAGRFLPLAFAFAAFFAVFFIPLADRPSKLAQRELLIPLSIGVLLMSIQAIGMTFTLAKFGDATRVNIVYSLRGIWGVVFTWLLAKRLKIDAAQPSPRIMLQRLIGALLIGVAVVASLV